MVAMVTCMKTEENQPKWKVSTLPFAVVNDYVEPRKHLHTAYDLLLGSCQFRDGFVSLRVRSIILEAESMQAHVEFLCFRSLIFY